MTKSTKQLAIELAEKLGDGYKWIDDDADGFMFHKETDDDMGIEEYIKTKAAEILFQEGMAGKIDGWLFSNLESGGGVPEYVAGINADIEHQIREWWATLTPIKVIEVYLAMEEE